MAEQCEPQFGFAELRHAPLKANGFSSITCNIASMLIALKSGAFPPLILGVSGAIALPFIPMFSSAKIYTNADGNEWKRRKWGRFVSSFLRWSEWLAASFPRVIIADNEPVSHYLQQEYRANSETIAYGADHALRAPATAHPLLEVMIGNWFASECAHRLWGVYKGVAGLQLSDLIYDAGILRGFRDKATLYVHGHLAGGTNPSLVEAMFCGLPVLAFDCKLNRSTTAGPACYFRSADELSHLATGRRTTNSHKMDAR